jgi:TolA-binding protein
VQQAREQERIRQQEMKRGRIVQELMQQDIQRAREQERIRQQQERIRQQQEQERQLQMLLEQQRQQTIITTQQPQLPIVAEPITYRDILIEAGLGEYIPMFERHRITEISMIRSLTNEELREIGIEAIGDRRRIIEAFARAPQNKEVDTRTNTGGVGPANQKGVHNLGFCFIYGWGTGLGASFAWNAGAINDMFSLGGGLSYSKITNGYLQNRYFAPNFRFTFHLFSIPPLARNESLSKQDLHIATRMGLWFNWWEHASTKGGSTRFMFDIAVVGYRLHFSEKTYLLLEGGTHSLATGLGFRF